jgi:excisionase family DNA binding protein
MEFLTAKELADYIKLKKSTIYDKVKEKTIPYYQIGGAIRFEKGEIDKWIKSKSVPCRNMLKILDSAA